MRVALHHHRPIADMRQQHVRDIGVILKQVPFGDAELGPERLAQVGDAHLDPPEPAQAAGGPHLVDAYHSRLRRGPALLLGLLPVGLVHERPGRQPCHLVRTPAQDGLDRGRDVGDAALGIDHGHHVHGVLHQRAEPLLPAQHLVLGRLQPVARPGQGLGHEDAHGGGVQDGGDLPRRGVTNQERRQVRGQERGQEDQ